MTQPLLIGGLLAYFNPKGPTKGELDHAYICALGLTLNMMASMTIFHANFLEMFCFGMKVRVACCSIVFRKVLKQFCFINENKTSNNVKLELIDNMLYENDVLKCEK